MNYQKKLPLAEKLKVQNDLTTSVEKKKNRTKINEKFFEESQILKTYIIPHPTQRTRVKCILCNKGNEDKLQDTIEEFIDGNHQDNNDDKEDD
jgi:hypothetical protein